MLSSDPHRYECILKEQSWEVEVWERDLEYLDYLESVLIPINETDACFFESCEAKLFVWESGYDKPPPPGTALTCLVIGGTFLILCTLAVGICGIIIKKKKNKSNYNDLET